MNLVYVSATFVTGTLLLVCIIVPLFVGYFCYDFLKDSVSKKAVSSGLMLLGAQVTLSIAAGWFAMVVYFQVETYLRPPPQMPQLKDLPRESGGSAGSQYSKTDSEDDEFNSTSLFQDCKDDVTTKLVGEMRKCVLRRDRMALCEKMCSKLPRSAYVTKEEVDKILRFFIDPADGLHIICMFEPFMANKDHVQNRNQKGRR
eukprot:GEMP01045707.1.p1 GENE.GEMP01045707.1~~GEMP01045707.1.p1  ORF type:complete len:201 (+),score=33.15 GEMP01045707.1:264-866(+)